MKITSEYLANIVQGVLLLVSGIYYPVSALNRLDGGGEDAADCLTIFHATVHSHVALLRLRYFVKSSED